VALAGESPQAPVAKPGIDWQLALILLIAWGLRFGAARFWPNIQWPDEIYQALEPAHRLVFGYGLLSWEWHEGVRSPVLPGFFAGPLEIAKWLDLGPDIYLLAIQALLCALSLSIVWVAYLLGADSVGTSARMGAAVAAAPAALMFDLVLFAPHALADCLATYLMVPGLYLLQAGSKPTAQGEAMGRKRDAGAGALLALAAALRPPLGLPLLLGILLTLRGRHDRWVHLISGALPMLVVYGAADLLQGQWPYESTLRYIVFFVEGPGAAQFGTETWSYYASIFVLDWGGAVPFLLLLICMGARGNVPWLAVPAGLMLELLALAHKEYRFVFPAIACLMIPVGVGAARVAAMAASAWARPDAHRAVVRIAWLAASACSLTLARQPLNAEKWFRGAAVLQAFEALHADPSVCGVGLLADVPLVYTPGYVVLHRNIPILDNMGDSRIEASRVNNILSGAPLSQPSPDFTLDRCWGGARIGINGPTTICRYRRSGSCLAP